MGFLKNWKYKQAEMNKNGSLPKLFISYSKDDIAFQKSLLKHLAGLRNKIVTWHDQDMLPGEEWDESIKAKLRSADVVLYLVTHNSIATNYIQSVELPLIEERCQNKACVLIPVIVDFCYWDDLDFAKYNALPNKGVPITDKSWANQNEAWLKVVQGIKRIIEKVMIESSVIESSIVIPEPKPAIILPAPKPHEDWQIIDQYRVKGGLAFDTKTGLLWLRFVFGQTWQNGTTQGQAARLTWKTAFTAINDFNAEGGYAGYSDWRLPTINELRSLYDPHYKLKEGVFPNTNSFWSAYACGRNEAWLVGLSNGYNSWFYDDSNDQVRLVRSGQ
jgi:hypothetical protein